MGVELYDKAQEMLKELKDINQKIQYEEDLKKLNELMERRRELLEKFGEAHFF